MTHLLILIYHPLFLILLPLFLMTRLLKFLQLQFSQELA